MDVPFHSLLADACDNCFFCVILFRGVVRLRCLFNFTSEGCLAPIQRAQFHRSALTGPWPVEPLESHGVPSRPRTSYRPLRASGSVWGGATDAAE